MAVIVRIIVLVIVLLVVLVVLIAEKRGRVTETRCRDCDCPVLLFNVLNCSVYDVVPFRNPPVRPALGPQRDDLLPVLERQLVGAVAIVAASHVRVALRLASESWANPEL